MTLFIYRFHVQQVNMWKNCSLLQKIQPNHHLNSMDSIYICYFGFK